MYRQGRQGGAAYQAADIRDLLALWESTIESSGIGGSNDRFIATWGAGLTTGSFIASGSTLSFASGGTHPVACVRL